MYKCSYKGILIAAVAATLTGCATVSYLAGIDTFWGDPLPVTKQGKAYALYLTGVIHERQGDMEKAADAWNGVIKLDEQALVPRLRLIGMRVRQNNNDQALALCKQTLRQFPNNAELWIVFGELNHQQGDIETAIAAFTKAIELKPEDLTGYGALVELQESTNDLVAAIDIYERLIERSPKSAALYYQLGINLAQIHDTENARKNFEKVLEMEPRITRARYFLALTLFESGAYEQCAEELKTYLLERPYDTSALEYRAAALARTGRLDEARYSLELILSGKEASKKHSLQYAWILLESDQIERAQQFALEAESYLFADIIFAHNLLSATSSKEVAILPWDDRFSLDDVETESDVFVSSIISIFGKDAAGSTVLAMLTNICDAVDFSPALTLFRGRILLYLEHHAEAAVLFESILENGITSKYAHYHCALAYEELDDLVKTEYHLRAYLELEPDDPDALNFLGYFYADHDMHLDEAEELLNRALKQDSENPFYLDSLGWLYYKKGKTDRAGELIRSAIYNMNSDDALLRDHLGDVYLLQGDTKRALSEWRRALRLEPSLDQVRDKINAHTKAEN